MKTRFLPLGALILCAIQASTAHGAAVSLAWDPNTAPEIAGYRVHYGTTSGSYTQMVDVGNVTTVTVDNLTTGNVYFFVATSYDTAGTESSPSNEVAYTAPLQTPTPAPQINVAPSSVNFSAVVLGLPPASQSVQITTSNGAPWSSSDSSPWFDAHPTSGPSGTSTTLTPSILGLLAGIFHQNITFSAAGLPDRVVVVTLTLFASPTPTPTPPTNSINISGSVSNCANLVPGPVPNVMLTLTGGGWASVLANDSGNYQFSSLPSGGSYIVTPSMAPRLPGSPGINTLDVMAAQRHFLGTTVIPPGCGRTAADVNGIGGINTLDAILIQRFFLGYTGAANVGKYQFTPANRAYSGVVNNQTGQNYNALIFGDIVGPFVDGRDIPPEPTTVEGEVALPQVAIEPFVTNFVTTVTTTAIDPDNRLVGFQGDFTFDERVVGFQSEPVESAGLTANNWNVSANVLPGEGPIRILRISAFSNDFTPLSGSGILFNLNMTRVTSDPGESTPLTWDATADQFIFIDADLNERVPSDEVPGSIHLE